MLSGATLTRGRHQVPYLEIINNVTYKHRVAGDPITNTIDQLYDKLDAGIDLVGSVFRTREPERVAEPISSTPVIESRAPKQLGGFRIIEATDAITGVDSFVVTNGNAKAECSTRELAEKILKAMSEATTR